MFARSPLIAALYALLAAGAASPALAQGSTGDAGLREHCECIAQAERQFNPLDDYESDNANALRSEAELRWWRRAEGLYASCMTELGAAPRDDPFPYGVSDYPGGPEFRPAECAGRH